MFGNSATSLAEHAEGVCFIDEEEDTMALGQLDQRRQWNDVSFHGIHGINCNQSTRDRRCLPKQPI